MCIALLLIYAIYCLLKDFINWLGYTISKHQGKQVEAKRHSSNEQKPISMNELLTFEELLEDDENNK